jgi:hypothetical protein
VSTRGPLTGSTKTDAPLGWLEVRDSGLLLPCGADVVAIPPAK